MRNHRAKGSRPASGRRRVATAMVLLLCLLGLVSWGIESLDTPPRTLAHYVKHRIEGHSAWLVESGTLLAKFLSWLDRRCGIQSELVDLWRDARTAPQTTSNAPAVPRHIVLVATAADAARAIEGAQPGDTITFMPGTYRFADSSIAARRAGTAAAGITVRAEQQGTVRLEFDIPEGFVVSQPYWTFENLIIRGVCRWHSDCEHAFHVVAHGAHFAALRNKITDFNAHFKINGSEGAFPDDGLIEGNTLSNSSIRETESSVTPIDLVGASRWAMRNNWISDFVKSGSNRVSYGAFAKGSGTANVFERNVVQCERVLRGAEGQRIGISLGGGGTGKQFCRDERCITEQDAGIVRSNLIMSCSDDGIYVNRSARSQVHHNTLIDTAGISVRFAESSADVTGNLVDGTIRSRDGSALHASDNIETALTRLYLGNHPVRGLFRNATELDLMWAKEPPRRQQLGNMVPDLCGSARPPQPAYGAFEDFSKCLRAVNANAQSR
jgi:Right handed beta helix region